MLKRKKSDNKMDERKRKNSIIIHKIYVCYKLKTCNSYECYNKHVKKQTDINENL